MRIHASSARLPGRTARLWLPVLLLLGVAGCGGDSDPKTLEGNFGDDGTELAAEVTESAQAETGDNVEVTCPDRVEINEGEHVDCEAKVGGNTRKVRVSRKDDVYRWQLYDFLDADKVEDEIEHAFKKRRNQTVSADCERVPIEKGHVSSCTASTARREYRIRVRQTNDVGDIRWDVVK